jgi:hypothetical protein
MNQSPPWHLVAMVDVLSGADSPDAASAARAGSRPGRQPVNGMAEAFSTANIRPLHETGQNRPMRAPSLLEMFESLIGTPSVNSQPALDQKACRHQ